MKYLEISIKIEQSQIDPLTCILEDMGIAGFVVEDPEDVEELLRKEHDYDWDYVDDSVLAQRDREAGITLYLEDDSTAEQKRNDIRKRVKAEIPSARFETRTVCDDDWKDKWKEYFKPARITRRVVIKPSWEDYVKETPEELVIELDPGMAFGTGTHPTTTLCVRLMEKYLEAGKDSVLDVGCGSGILSIAAAKLGAHEILGVDIDPVAVEVSLENVKRNGLTSQIEIREGDLTKGLSVKADLVVANLMADLVMLLSRDVAKHLKGKGIYISSGILVEKKELVARAVRDCGFEILEIPEEGEWCAIAARLPGGERSGEIPQQREKDG